MPDNLTDGGCIDSCLGQNYKLVGTTLESEVEVNLNYWTVWRIGGVEREREGIKLKIYKTGFILNIVQTEAVCTVLYSSLIIQYRLNLVVW